MLSERSQMQKTVYWCDSIYMKCPERTHLFIYFKDFIYLLEGREREGNIGARAVDWLPLACPHLGIWPENPSTCPDWE